MVIVEEGAEIIGIFEFEGRGGPTYPLGLPGFLRRADLATELPRRPRISFCRARERRRVVA
jgi:hypothetical protein